MQAENKLPTDTIVEFIKTFVETEDGYTVGQTAAQYAYPFIQPVPFPEEENKKDRHKNMVNGYLGAGYATAIDRLAPFIRATLQQKKSDDVSSASDEEAGFNYTNNRLMYEERKPDFIARQHDIRLAFLSGCTHVRNSLSANNKEKETGGYLESEKQFQIIALRALGLDYEKLGCTFEQSINGVIHMAVSAKQELKEKDELLKQAALSLQGMIILWQQLSKVLLPVADELAYKKAIEVYEIVTSNQ